MQKKENILNNNLYEKSITQNGNKTFTLEEFAEFTMKLKIKNYTILNFVITIAIGFMYFFIFFYIFRNVNLKNYSQDTIDEIFTVIKSEYNDIAIS